MTALPHPPEHWQDCPHGGEPATCPPCQRARRVHVPLVERVVIYAHRYAERVSGCADCASPIEPGDLIALAGEDRQDAEWMHARCAELLADGEEG